MKRVKIIFLVSLVSLLTLGFLLLYIRNIINVHAVKTNSTISLASLAEKNDLKIGSEFDPNYAFHQSLNFDNTYTAILLHEFNLIVPGNNFKMKLIHPEQSRYDFTVTDMIVDFALEHHMDIHGHTLIWGNPKSLPKWLQDNSWKIPGRPDRDVLIDILKNHIKTIVGRYKGKVKAWDVVNEAFCDPANHAHKWSVPCIVIDGKKGGMDASVWRTVIGPEYIEIALQAAHEADPDAYLYINDNNYESINSPKSDKIYSFVKDLIERKVPINGVGQQMHIPLDAVDFSQYDRVISLIQQNFRKFNDLGLDMIITELDVRIKKSLFGPSDTQLKNQAKVFASMLKICMDSKCPSFTVWGFTDKYSWIPGHKKGYDYATPFDDKLRPKPAYYSLQEILKIKE